MSDCSELRRLAVAIHGPGSTIAMLQRWREFESACHPKIIVDLIDERDQLKAENEELIAALNDILRVTPMAVEAFGIAALVLGELGVSKDSTDTCRSEQGPETPESPAQQGYDCRSGRP